MPTNIRPERHIRGGSTACVRQRASTAANVPSRLARRIFSTTFQPRTYSAKLRLLER